MRGTHAAQAQFEIMIEYMERHGDLSQTSLGNTQARLGNLQKWIELTNILNDKTNGEPKPIDKWRKCWSDFKNNTKKKIEKIKKNGGNGPDLTDVERRLLIFMGDRKHCKRKAIDSDDNSVIMLKEEISEPDPCQRTSTPPSQFICAVDGEAPGRRQSSASSYESTSSSSQQPTVKRKKRFRDSVQDLTDRYIEFEREREKMAHEREMARIKQNDQLVTIFGRIVNVLETLAPSIQRYLDRSTDDG